MTSHRLVVNIAIQSSDNLGDATQQIAPTRHSRFPPGGAFGCPDQSHWLVNEPRPSWPISAELLKSSIRILEIHEITPNLIGLI